MLSTIFYIMCSTLDYSTGGIENKPICENLSYAPVENLCVAI